MNTKKMLPLFVLVPVVVVLGVALGVLNHADTEEEDTSIALCSLDADSVTAIAYKDASDGATLESALTKTDDTWTLDSDPALPLDQSKAQGVADSMTALTALRELSDDADVASMGFDTPTYELSLKTADTEWTLTVGSKNSITNNWYARLSADGPVYTLDSSALSGICKTAKQLYAAQSITDIDVDDVTKMVVQTANGMTSKSLPLRETEGMVCSEFVMCYPPGIPILAPGERITKEILNYIEYAKAKGCSMTGPEDPDILHLNVLA